MHTVSGEDVTPSGNRRAALDDLAPRLNVFAVFVIATLMHGIGVFAYDATAYWAAPLRLVGTHAVSLGNYYDGRGVLTAIMYLPAAALSALLGQRYGNFAVLLENALVFAWFAAFLLPSIVWHDRPVPARGRWILALLTWLVLFGFAPYPLTDAFAAIACVAFVSLFVRGSRVALVGAGLCAGVAVNLRPAYLVTVALMVLVALIWRRWSGLFTIAGIAIALTPQVLLNVIRSSSWSLWPVNSASVVAAQTGPAAYIVKYDTILDTAIPQQSYCSPQMAREIGARLPTTTGELASVFLKHLPTSAVFSVEKLAGVVHWPLATPYGNPTLGLDGLYAFFITGLTVIGVCVILASTVRTRAPWDSERWAYWAVLLAILVGGIITLVGAEPESRYALPVVLVGLIGCAMIADRASFAEWAQGGRWVVAALVVLVAITVTAHVALSHPAPPGIVTQAICKSVP